MSAVAPPRALVRSPGFLATLLLAALVWTLDLAVLDAGVPHPLDDSWEDAIVARMLVEGHGFRSHMIYPPLWELRDPRTLTVPVLVHGPLVPLLFVLPLQLLGERLVDHVAWIAAALAVLTLVPLFRLAARHFGEPTATAAGVLFTLSPLTIAAVNHYLTVVLGALLLTVSLDLLARERPRPLAAGIVSGLCYLARPEMLVAAPVLAFLAAGGRERRLAAIYLAAFVAIASVWWWERWRTAGSPFFSISNYLLVLFSPAFPGDALVRDFASTPRRFPSLLAEALPELWRKWAHFFPRAVKRALTTPSGATGWLVPLGAFGALLSPRHRKLALALALLGLIPVIAITLLASVRLYPVPFLPLYCIAAALGAQWVFERLPRWAHRPRAWLSALVLASLPPAVIEIQEQAREARALEGWLASDRAALAPAARSPENAGRPMFSDTPDFVAWTTRRPTLWLRRDEFDRLYHVRERTAPPGIPARPDPADTWFHDRNPNESENQAGRRIER